MNTLFLYKGNISESIVSVASCHSEARVCAFCVCVLTNVYKLKGLTCLKFEHGVLNLYLMSGAWMVLGFGWISDLHPPKRR